QRVGSFGFIVEDELTSGRNDTFWPRGVQSPASDVQKLRAPQAQFARSVIPAPAPVIVKFVSGKRPLWRGTEPGREIDSRGRIARRGRQQRLSLLHEPRFRRRNSAQLATVNQADRRLKVFPAPLLQADLHDPLR